MKSFIARFLLPISKAQVMTFAALAVTTAGITVGARYLPADTLSPAPFTPPIATPIATPIAPPIAPPIAIEPIVAPIAMPVDPIASTEPGQVVVRGTLAQPKLAQNGSGQIFYEVSIETPAQTAIAVSRKATDMILVLDRSGSMGDQNKLGYAKAAIQELLSQLNREDRFALVSFDDSARVDIPLTAMTPEARSRAQGVVSQIQPGGSTNMSDGFQAAERILHEAHGNGRNRSTRVLLLSDGEANEGVFSVEGLSNIVKGLTHQDAVVSTIGMGLDFSQNMLSTLADQGMGNYSYLESLAGLDRILMKDLKDSRSTYATTSQLQIQLGEGVSVVDASGYPIDSMSSRQNAILIPTGQLLSGSKKTFMLTLNVPTDRIRSFQAGRMSFTYTHDGVFSSARVPDDSVSVSVVKGEREAVASIRRDVYQQAWSANNLGVAKAKFAAAVASGNRAEALGAISSYQSAAKSAEGASGMALNSPAVSAQLGEMQADAAAAFTGDKNKDQETQNRLAKKVSLDARTLQRSN